MKKFIGVILAIVAFALLAVGCQRAERPGRDATYEITITNQSSWEGATHINFYDFNGEVKGTADIQSGKASITLKKGNYFVQISDAPESVSYNLPVLTSTEITGEIVLTDASTPNFGVLGVVTKNGLPLKNYCAILTYKPISGDGYTLDPINTDKNGVISVGLQPGDYHVTVYSHSDAYTTYEFDVSVTSGTRFFLAELTQADKVTHDEPVDPGRGDEEDPDDPNDPNNPSNPDPDDPNNPDVTDPDNPDPDDPNNPDVTDPDNPDPDNPDPDDPDDPDVTDPDDPDEPSFPEPDPDDMYTKRPDPNNPPKMELYKGKMTFWVMVNRLNGYKLSKLPQIKITNESGEVEFNGYVPTVPVTDVTNPALAFNMLEIKLPIEKHYVNVVAAAEGYEFDPNYSYEMDENNYVLDIRLESHLLNKELRPVTYGEVFSDVTFHTLNAGDKKLSEILTESKLAAMYFYAGNSNFDADAAVIQEVFTKYGNDVAFIFFTTSNTAGYADSFQTKYNFTGKYYLVKENNKEYYDKFVFVGATIGGNAHKLALVDSGGAYIDLFLSNIGTIKGIKDNFEKAIEVNRFDTPSKKSNSPEVKPSSFESILPERKRICTLAA